MKLNKSEYFGASNSYNGFYSQFKRIFNRSNFETLYILKGGPGTGKSTLMKTIAKKAEQLNLCVEKIYCSSDPKSLDGIIIFSNGRRIGIVDGTAPHTEDTIYPGAVDRLINLGRGFDFSLLKKERDQIIKLSQSKSTSYKKAYKALNEAGLIFNKVLGVISDIGFYFKADQYFDNLRNSSILPFSNESLIMHSFSRSGLTSLISTDVNTFIIHEDGFSEYAIINELSIMLNKYGIKHTRLLSPLAPMYAIGISIGSLLIIPGKTEDDSASIHPYLDSLEFKELKTKHDELISIAKDDLSIASECHFAIENIYSKAMDFGIIDEITKRIIDDIEEFAPKKTYLSNNNTVSEKFI